MSTTTRRKPNPDEVYVARESISLGITTINAGDRRRGDDPLVREHFAYWAPDGTAVPRVPPPNPRIRTSKRAPSDYDVTAHEAVLPLDVLVTRTPLKVRRAADDSIVQLPKGTAFTKDAELPRLIPEAFADPKTAVKR